MLKKGSKVLIKKTSQFYTQAPDIVGTILSTIKDTNPQWVQVEFANGYYNNYRIFRLNPADNDLVPAREIKVTMTRKQ